MTKPRGVVAANVWDHGSDAGPLSLFWRAVRDLDPSNPGEGGLPGASEGHLQRLFEEAGLLDIEASTLTVRASYTSFDDWWTPYTYGIGPAGAYVAGQDDDARRRLREHCAELVPDGPFELSAAAWTVVSRA